MKLDWQAPDLEIYLFSADEAMTVSGEPNPGDQGTPWV